MVFGLFACKENETKLEHGDMNDSHDHDFGFTSPPGGPSPLQLNQAKTPHRVGQFWCRWCRSRLVQDPHWCTKLWCEHCKRQWTLDQLGIEPKPRRPLT